MARARSPQAAACGSRTATLDPAAKTCDTPRHDGFGNHLLHYYRELT